VASDPPVIAEPVIATPELRDDWVVLDLGGSESSTNSYQQFR
jgi:hypothetical protein